MKMELNHKISKPVDDPTITILSLGAGVQSSVMLLMGLQGCFGNKPDHVIFSDTGWEPQEVYDHLDWLESEARKLSNHCQFHRVSIGNIRENLLGSGNQHSKNRFASIPFFLENGGMGRRQCTNEYKLQPIVKKTRELLGLEKGERVKPDQSVEMWIGISCDEMQRLKENNLKYITNRWPLIEVGYRRHHCMKWFNERYPDRKLAKSACIGCPYTDDKRWLDMKKNDPKSFEDACYIDDVIRESGGSSGKMENRQFIHRSCKPLREVDFEAQDDQGDLFGFENECDGMCGM